MRPSGAAHLLPSSSLFEKAIGRRDRLVGSASRQTAEQFREARLVRITHGGAAIRVNPVGMLDPQIVVNLFPKLGVGVDLVIHGNWLGERFNCSTGRLPQWARRNCR